MSTPIRILDTGLKPARWNVAMTAALAELHARYRIPDTVRFHSYPACVLLGRSQAVERAADLGYCRSEGLEIARRITGGGAVFMSPSTLAWDVAVHRRACGDRLEAVTRRLCEGVAAGLLRLGAAARFRAPGDIEIEGRKVSGSSGHAVRRSVLLQGTVLIEKDVSTMAGALRIPEAVLGGKVTSLEEALGTAPPLAAIMEVITLGIAQALQREAAPGHPTDEETALCEDLLRSEIGTDAFASGAAGVVEEAAG